MKIKVLDKYGLMAKIYTFRLVFTSFGGQKLILEKNVLNKSFLFFQDEKNELS